MIGQRAPKQSARDEREAYELVELRDMGVCVRCRRGGDPQRDHRQNRQSGNTVVSNLQLLCGPFAPDGGCHLWKTEHPLEAIREGWAVPRWATPSEWPARRYLSSLAGLRLTWVIYGDDGSVTEISAAEARERMNGGAS